MRVSCFALCLLLFAKCGAAESLAAPWDPLARQGVEPDTLYLLDAEQERALAAGDGGLIPGNANRDAPWSRVAAVPGKYRTGLRSVDRDWGYVWMPSLGLIAPDEFTIELWLKCDRPWAEVSDSSPFSLWDERGTVGLRIHVHQGRLQLSYQHTQSPEGKVSATITRDLERYPLAGGVWTNLAVTFKGGVLRLYLDQEQVGEVAGLRPPVIWSDAARSDGLCLGGGAGRGAPEFTLSDLRISRRARTPGAATPVDDVNTLTVEPARTAGDRVRQTLLGALHTLKGPTSEAMARGVLRVLRTDKLLVATPIKEGLPSPTHPSRGVSQRFAYDWQVVDRSLEYYRRLGVTPYLSIDATPQLLGGSVPPFSGEKLLLDRSFTAAFPTEVPRDMDAYGAVVRDLVDHVVKVRKHTVPYWGVWNEPNGTLFWNNSLEDYLRLYEACARAVKSVDPALKVGGPETADWDPRWVEALIRFCAERKLPLDFVSWHYYLNTVSEIPRAQAEVAYWSRRYGLKSPPELLVGEWCWQIHNVPRSGYLPWSRRNFYVNDWHAAFTGASLIEMQRAGVTAGIYTNAIAEAGATGLDASGLMSSSYPWANLNVFRLWSMLAPEIVTSRYDGRPGVFSLASRDDRGRVTILLAHLRYRKDLSPEIRVKVAGLRGNTRVTHYVVDDQHSNRYDAGEAHTELETVPPPAVTAGELRVRMRPRSVHLLVIEGGAP